MSIQDLVTPLLALFGALAGGVLSQLFSGGVAERRGERQLIRDARMQLERCPSSRVVPGLTINYPGMSQSVLMEVTDYANRNFLQRNIDLSFELMVSLGAVRSFDRRIEEIVESYEMRHEWHVSQDDVPTLRAALREAETRVRLWCFWK